MNTIQISKLADVTLTLAPEAVALKASALTEAKTITAVSDAFTNQNAADALVALQKIIKVTETSRTQIKAPVLELGKAIDKLARDFLVNDVEVEKSRLQKLMADYARIQEEARAEEQRKRDEELRKAEAALKKADNSGDDEKRIEAEQKANAARNAPVVQVEKAQGASSKEVWKFEVTDINALFLANPKLCKVESSPAAINRELACGVRKIPGLRIYSEMQIVARG